MSAEKVFRLCLLQEAIEEYFGTPRNQLIFVAGAGIVAAGAVVAYNIWWR